MRHILTFVAILAALFLMAACSPGEESTPTVVAEVETQPTVAIQESAEAEGTAAHRWTEDVEATATQTKVPEPTETAAPTTAPTVTPEIVASVDDECLACHMNQEMLMETAAPEEQAPSESSGVG